LFLPPFSPEASNVSLLVLLSYVYITFIKENFNLKKISKKRKKIWKKKKKKKKIKKNLKIIFF